MVNSSNLYADKILQQHPLALWTLDSDAKYLSLITDAQRNLSTNWTFTSSFLGTTTTELDPKLGTTVSLLYKDGVSSGTYFTATSDFTFNSNSDSFTIGAYISKASPYITQVAIGYDIGGTITYSSPTITITQDMYNYQYVSATFNTTVTGAKVVLRFNYSAPASADRVAVMVNGLTVGKWAEDFNVEDLGSQKSTIPTTIAIPKTSGILASQYNTAFNQPTGTYTDKQGYYIVQGDVAYARNTGHPMVYGCTNSTKIYPYTANEPSLILPGYGFLNEVDKYKTKTYEMWLRINSSTLSMKRIMGPVFGNDGLYVDAANLILKVGTYFISHYVGEWDRLMLVQIITSKDGIQMFLNGDVIGNISYAVKDIPFSEYYYPTTLDNKIINSNFENHNSGWGTRNGSNARSTGDSFIGSASILYTVGSTGTTGGINTVTTPTTVAITAVTPSSPSVGYVKYTGNNIYSVGDTVTTSLLAPAGYNGTFTVTEATETYFVVANATTTTVTDGVGSSSSTSTKLIPISPGNTYTYSIYMKDVNTGKQYNNVIDYYNSSLGLISGSSSIGPATTISSSDWTRVTYTFTVPETVGTSPTVPAYARPYTYSNTTFAVGDSGKTVYYDGALFQQSTLANPYVYKTPASNIEQDWIGFYAHSDVSLEVSCVAVYNYGITKSTALSRFSYGQAVGFPKDVVSAYSGSAIVPDYTLAKYANNQNYGVSQSNTWKSAVTNNNFIIDKDTLSTPNYTLPIIEIEPSSTLTQTDMLNALSSINATYFDLQPNSTWNGIESRISFNNFKQISNDIDMFYTVFDKSENNTDTKQIIFQIVDINKPKNYLEVSILNNTLGYYFYYNSDTASTLATFSASSLNTKYAAAINITNLVTKNSNFSKFFANRENLKIYVGGSKDFTDDQTFTGKIYRVGFGDLRNYGKVSSSFNPDGYYSTITAGNLNTHIANYTLLLNNGWSGQSFMDIAVNSYWQDIVPLSRLAKTVDGQYRLDYLQFNVDYPNQIDATSADTKTYLTFQTGGNPDITTFANTTIVGTDRYLNITSAWTNTKYQVTDGTVVYIPTNVSSSTLTLGIHIETNSPGVIMNPTNIRHLQIAAQAIGSSTTIGTNGDELISFGAGNNPILISKSNDPYYYLTSQSGFRVVGTNASTRGYYSNINKDKYDDFSIGAIQFSAKFPLTQFANTETLMFELENVDDSTKVKFYVIGETSALTRGRIYAKDQSGAVYTSLKYYLNGVEVDRAIVSVDEWFMLGIKFTTDYSLNSKAGKFNFSGKQLINHFEYFQPNSSQRNSPIYIYPKWINVRYSATASKIWNDYTALTWQDVATSPATSVFVGTNPSNIQEVFSGTGKNIVGNDYNYPYLIPQSFSYRAFMAIETTTSDAILL